MKADWSPLDAELAAWRAEGLTLPLWWRDDDAVAATPQLETLSELSRTLDLPVHLAIIPRDADAGLVDYVGQRSTLIPVVHGWAHQNHAPPEEKKSEFQLHRPMPDILADARAGIERLRALFEDRLCPIFVPMEPDRDRRGSGIAGAGVSRCLDRNPAKDTNARARAGADQHPSGPD